MCNTANIHTLSSRSLAFFGSLLKMSFWTFPLKPFHYFYFIQPDYGALSSTGTQTWGACAVPQCHTQRPPPCSQFNLNLVRAPSAAFPKTTWRCVFNLVPLFQLRRGLPVFNESVCEAWAPWLAPSVTKLHTFTLIETRGAPACCLLLQP